MSNTQNERTAASPATRPVNDCAWCGTGEGICQAHLDALLAQSLILATTGQYRARDDGEKSKSQHWPSQGAKEEQEVSA